MQFVHPMFLAGLAGAAMPVVIHLLTRDRVRKVEFSTLRFFAKNSQRVLRRKKWQEMLLLALRMAMCALLAAAFARPFLAARKDENAGHMARRARVVVVDVSASMARGDASERAKKAANRALGELSNADDAGALVAFSDAAQVAGEWTRNIGELRSKVDGLAAGQGGTNIGRGLVKADELLKGMAAKEKDIVLISDLQRSGWNKTGERRDWKLAGDVKLLVESVAPESGVLPHSDLAIVDRYCPESVVLDGTAQTISVKLANRGTGTMNDVPVKLRIDEKDIATQKVNLKARASMLVQFSHVFEQIGDRRVEVHAGTEEGKTTENTVYFNPRAIGKIPVLVINGAPSRNRAADGAYFLDVALSPKGSPPFEVKTVDASVMKADDVSGAMVCVLSDTDRVGQGVVKALRELLERGGGILFLPGERVSAEAFNREFSGMAPCNLKAVMQTPPVTGEVGGIALGKIDFEHPVFHPFAAPHHGDFATVRFFRWWDVRDYQGSLENGKASRVTSRFEDGRPAVLERPVGRGISMLMTSSTDLRWTNFAEKAAVFQPFVHLAAKYLSIRTEKRTAYLVGEVLPDGTIANDVGFHQVKDKDTNQQFICALNTDPAEVDIGTVTPDEVVAAVGQSPEERTNMATAGMARDAKELDGRIWWWLTVAVAVLLAVELFVANRTLRH